ncbi:MAG TPA: hypothetical protein VF166_09075 [Gemmatimonadaceae bacterium]
MQRRAVRLLPLVGVLAWAVATACGGSSTAPVSTNAALIGTYDLSSLTFQGQPTITPPAATGTLTLADSTYTVSLTVPPDTTAVTDSGTYTISGNNWTQTSKVQPVQSVGTYTFANDTLTVNVTTLSMQVSTVWKKR